MTDTITRSLGDLRAAVAGKVITADDPRYDATRAIFMGGFDRRPAAVVRPVSDQDVARTVSFAAATGAEVAVRSGGHSAAGHSTTEGGLVIDMRSMRGLDLDPAARTAWAETGLTAGEYTSVASAHGLATGFGDTATVGIGGLTLAGGIGFLVRRHGLTIDNLLAADVVTADGQIRRADANTNADLFWAIRGGGGNFGVVTRMQFRLHEVDEVTGGMLILPATPEVVAGSVAEADAASDDLSVIAMVMTAPPMPFIPPEVHGQKIALLLMVHAGSLADGERSVARFRNLATPLADQIGPIRYREMFPPEEADFHPVGSSHATFLDEFDAGTAELIITRLDESTADMAAVQIRVLGGAVARVAAGDTAFAHRQRRMMVNVAAMVQQGDPAPHRRWVANTVSDLTKGEDNGAYVGFLSDHGGASTRSAYPAATWDRLASVKATYDPANLFRLNHNVEPSE